LKCHSAHTHTPQNVTVTVVVSMCVGRYEHRVRAGKVNKQQRNGKQTFIFSQ